MVCKICKKTLIKTPVIRGKTTRYVDEFFRLWNGATCPDCYREYNRERMRKKRAELRLQIRHPRNEQ